MTPPTPSLVAIAQHCFIDKYDPPQAIACLFSSGYVPEQDHGAHFLEIIANKNIQYTERVFAFFNHIRSKEALDDPPFQALFSRVLQKNGYENIDDVLQKYENYVREGVVRKSHQWENDLATSFWALNPPSLCALWAIHHEAKLSADETDYLIAVVAQWPFSDSRDNQMQKDARRALITSKINEVYEDKLAHQSGERHQRRAKAYSQGVLGTDGTARLSGVLHDIDHKIREWSYYAGYGNGH